MPALMSTSEIDVAGRMRVGVAGNPLGRRVCIKYRGLDVSRAFHL